RERAQHHGMDVVSEGDGTFATFIKMYRSACEVLRSPDDLARLVREIAEDGAAAGAVWVEPSTWITIDHAERLGLRDEQAYLESLLDSARIAEREVGVG